ncbi:MAG: type I glyceraldehyde-3-phosphate dehydrogenase [Patescibacteria group bacterium]|nr:type I glyceraldehyde-3-phosphate dehydrogenase [Patescibacteria group bacterium]
MPVRLGINGFGRIGRAAFRIARSRKNIEVVAINDITEPSILAHLLQYDTVYRTFDATVKASRDAITVDGEKYPVSAIKEPEQLPWGALKVDVVLECTGRFTKSTEAARHLKAGAKRVIISAPAKDEETQTLVLGTNVTVKAVRDRKVADVISNASCTTNCIAPVIEVLQDAFGISKAMMTTVHSYTADQVLVDGPHRDLRRARAAAANIVPTSTGAAQATAKVVPPLKGLFDGISIRVPTLCVSLSDITAVLKKKVTVEVVNDALRKASREPRFKGILQVCEDPLVSSDFIGNPYSAIVDPEYTRVVGGDLVKVLAWYDNEWGYAHRLVELAEAVGAA